MIRDFARNLVRITAHDAGGRPLGLVKIDKQSWRLDDTMVREPRVIHIRYQVFAWELSVRAAHLDTTHAYFNGPSLFLQVRGFEDEPCRVDLLPPEGDGYAGWRVATSLTPLGAEPLGFGTYRADDYADLIDHPVEMGHFALLPFKVRGVPHAMAITGRHGCDESRLVQDLGRICDQHATLFGELPIDRYLFLTTAVGEGHGGLEHRFSSSLICNREDLPRHDEESASEGYRRLLGLCSHEYFHLWHVKRIRPQALMDGGLDSEVHTRLLWAFEGITSYYDELALARSGCIDTRAYLQLLAETITRVMRNPGRLVQTLAESSFDAWTKFYKQDENAPNAIVSYYAKGALAALALDLTIRRETASDMSLDHLMRALWQRHGRTGLGVPERGVEHLAGEITGLDLQKFFGRALDSTEDLDIQGLLATVGVDMRRRPQNGTKDLGGCVDRFDRWKADPTLAVRLRPGSGDAVIQNVISGGAGEAAGLAPGDLVVAVDGLKATAENLERLIARRTAVAANGGGEAASALRLHVFRRDELIELQAHPQPAVADTCELLLLDPVPEPVAQARAAWLANAG
jgi:predicted metalloprotease with PDZ domain